MSGLDETRMRAHWTARAPAMLLAEFTHDGTPCATPFDRRWLWRLEGFLAVSGTNDTHRAMARDLAEYLIETCDHHWCDHHRTEAEAAGDWVGVPAHKQCLWCNDVVWLPADPEPALLDRKADK